MSPRWDHIRLATEDLPPKYGKGAFTDSLLKTSSFVVDVVQGVLSRL